MTIIKQSLNILEYMKIIDFKEQYESIQPG